MKKVLFITLALCFIGTLSYADKLVGKDLLKRANRGDADAQYEVAMQYYRGYTDGTGPARDYAKAVAWLNKATNSSNRKKSSFDNANYLLGHMYRTGEAGKKDYKLAEKHYEVSAKSDNQRAMFYLGEMYAEGGFGLRQNDRKSYQWYEKAAKLGHQESQLKIAQMRESGEGAFKSTSTAIKWYEEAGNSGDVEAQVALARIYLHGDGVSRNSRKALEWYSKAASADYMVAQHELGMLYYEGGVIGKNLLVSLRLLGRAAQQGYTPAIEQIALMKELGEIKEGDVDDKPRGASSSSVGRLEGGVNRAVLQDRIAKHTEFAYQNAVSSQYELGRYYYDSSRRILGCAWIFIAEERAPKMVSDYSDKCKATLSDREFLEVNTEINSIKSEIKE